MTRARHEASCDQTRSFRVDLFKGPGRTDWSIAIMSRMTTTVGRLRPPEMGEGREERPNGSPRAHGVNTHAKAGLPVQESSPCPWLLSLAPVH
jgi:hypothetical protein